MGSSQAQHAIELLSADPSRKSLLNLISWLDVACIEAPLILLPQQILARAVIAVGYLLQEKITYETVNRTLHAAECFALEPTPENFDDYQRVATLSYPFGSGDGCYAIPEIGYTHCEPGSGCRSGAGCLAHSTLEDGVVMQMLARELIPWLQSADDPVANRWNSA